MVIRHVPSIPGRSVVTRRQRTRRGGVLATGARIAHDLGLAAWFGGAAMGALGLNSATREVDDPSQRIRVANAGWFRWAPMTAIAIGAHAFGVFGRARWGGRSRLVAPGSVLALLRLALTGVAVGATIESGRAGSRVVAQGDVPVATAVVPISDTPDEVAAAMRRLRIVQWIMPLSTAGILAVNALQDDSD
jgi:hypothetical protein